MKLGFAAGEHEGEKKFQDWKFAWERKAPRSDSV